MTRGDSCALSGESFVDNATIGARDSLCGTRRVGHGRMLSARQRKGWQAWISGRSHSCFVGLLSALRPSNDLQKLVKKFSVTFFALFEETHPVKHLGLPS